MHDDVHGTGRRPGHWDGLAVPIAADRALLGPEASALLVRALDRLSRVDRVRLPPNLLHVRGVLELVSSHACAGHADVRDHPDGAASEEWMSTAEAADHLGYTHRHCTRLAADEAFGPARKVKGRWLVRRDEVAAYAAERKSA